MLVKFIAALACVPISPEAYEMVPLFLVPRTFLQAATLAGLSYVQYLGTRALTPRPWTHAAYLNTSMWLYGLLLFLPCVVMVVRRPNEAPCQSATS